MDKIIIGLRSQILVLAEDDLTAVQDELGVDYRILGKTCDYEAFGDHCNADCDYFCSGTCPAKLMRDNKGKLIHVVPIEANI